MRKLSNNNAAVDLGRASFAAEPRTSAAPASEVRSPLADAALKFDRSVRLETAPSAVVSAQVREENLIYKVTSWFKDAAQNVGAALAFAFSPVRLSKNVGFASALVGVGAVVAVDAKAGEQKQNNNNNAIRSDAHLQFAYPLKLALTTVPGKKHEFKILGVDGKSNEPSTAGKGGPIWFECSTMASDAQGKLTQKILPAPNVYDIKALGRELIESLEVPNTFRSGADLSVLQRSKRVTANEHGNNVSTLLVVSDKTSGDLYVGGLEVRWGTNTNLHHILRYDQWAGEAVEKGGYPSLQVVEHIKTESNGEDTQVGRMVRVLQVFPAVDGFGALVASHHVGNFYKEVNGIVEEQKVHVVTTVERGENGALLLKVQSVKPETWQLDGQKNRALSKTGYASDSVFGEVDQFEWSQRAGKSYEQVKAWETSRQPLDPNQRGIQPMGYFLGLNLPEKWDGKPLKAKNLVVVPEDKKKGLPCRVALDETMISFSSDVWKFDSKGELVCDTLLGTVDATAVRKYFEAQIAEAIGNEDRIKEIRHQVEVIVATASLFPQLNRDKPKGTEGVVKRTSVERLVAIK